MGQWTSCQVWASIQVFSIRTRAKNPLGTEAWYQQVIWQCESKDPLGKDAIGMSHPGMGHGKHGLRRGHRRPLSLDLNLFWRKHSGSSESLKKSIWFVFPHLSLCHLCNVSFYLPCTSTWASFFVLFLFLSFFHSFFFFFLNQPPCKKMIYQMTMLIPSGKPITPSSSIFVEIQNGWFSMEGIFLKM